MIKVLVVEDSCTVANLIIRLLESDPDIQVVGHAENGLRAIEMVKGLTPDLVTMDVVMPDMDGVEATRKIMHSHPTPILIVTAHADSPELNVAFEAMEAGALDMVSKPKVMGKDADRWNRDLTSKVKKLAAVTVKARPERTTASKDQKAIS